MAVEMVRKPSETPNIENVDDFMPIRYAYANQNGYVIGRGRIGTGIDTEAYTINGNTFTINSGRLVLQGVECDINTEHSIVIDVSATKRYYAVYLQVNLATNTSDILVTYDTLGTPSVDAGEDLTINSVGTARMILFTFEATNGIISNVIKVVNACEYSMPFRLDENGVLKVGDIIIPQKKLLWSGISYSSSSSQTKTINLNENLLVGDVVEIHYSFNTEGLTGTKRIDRFEISKFELPNNYYVLNETIAERNYIRTYSAVVTVYLNQITHTSGKMTDSGGGSDFTTGVDRALTIFSVYKVIE